MVLPILQYPNTFDLGKNTQKNPGFFSNEIYATSPLLFDSAGANAQDFGNSYQALYGKFPSYVGTKFYEAAILAVEAIRKAKIQNTVASRIADRDRVYVQLNKINNRKVAARGLTGLLYFDPQTRSNINQPVRIAQFYQRTLISAPRQFESVSNLERENLQRELQAGNVIQIDNDYFWRQSVVYTGLDINKLIRVDQKTSSFTAEFYLWFRYAGDIDISSLEFHHIEETINMQWICNFLRINRLAKYLAIALATLLVVGIITGIVRQLSPTDSNAIHIAIAAPVSSNRKAAAQEMIQSVQLYIKTVNNNGGINSPIDNC